MKNADMPAMPTADIDLLTERNDGLDESGRYALSRGLTKREMFAMNAMSAMLSSEFVSSFCKEGMGNQDEHYSEMHQGIAIEALNYADALLKELEKCD